MGMSLVTSPCVVYITFATLLTGTQFSNLEFFGTILLLFRGILKALLGFSALCSNFLSEKIIKTITHVLKICPF